jgi:hypothetical protein
MHLRRLSYHRRPYEAADVGPRNERADVAAPHHRVSATGSLVVEADVGLASSHVPPPPSCYSFPRRGTRAHCDGETSGVPVRFAESRKERERTLTARVPSPLVRGCSDAKNGATLVVVMVTNTQPQSLEGVRLMFPVLMSGRAAARGGLATVGWTALPPHPDAAEVRPQGGGDSTVRVRSGVLNDRQVRAHLASPHHPSMSIGRSADRCSSIRVSAAARSSQRGLASLLHS